MCLHVQLMKARKVIHNGKNRYLVQYTVDKKRHRKFFTSEGKALAFIAKHNRNTQAKGAPVAALASDVDELAIVMDAKTKLAKFGMSITQLVEDYIAQQERAGRTITLGELSQRWQSGLVADGKSQRYIAEVRHRFAAVLKHFGESLRLSDISAQDVDGFIQSLKVGPQTRNHYHRVLATALEYAVARGYIDSNPAAKVAKAKIVRDPPKVFSIAQIQKILAAATKAGPQVELFVAIGLYAGIRAESELELLQWEQINFEHKIIDVLPSRGKVNTRRHVDIHPPLMEILKKHRQLAGPLFPKGFNGSRTMDAFRASFDWIDNGLRHTFATMHAALGDITATSAQLGHTDTRTTVANYAKRGEFLKSQAQAFFGLVATKKKKRLRVAK